MHHHPLITKLASTFALLIALLAAFPSSTTATTGYCGKYPACNTGPAVDLASSPGWMWQGLTRPAGTPNRCYDQPKERWWAQATPAEAGDAAVLNNAADCAEWADELADPGRQGLYMPNGTDGMADTPLTLTHRACRFVLEPLAPACRALEVGPVDISDLIRSSAAFFVDVLPPGTLLVVAEGMPCQDVTHGRDECLVRWRLDAAPIQEEEL